MFTQFGVVRAAFGQNRLYVAHALRIRPKSRAVISRLALIMLGCLIVGVVSTVVVASATGAVPAIVEPPSQLLPGQVPPSDLRCGTGESAGESCYPPVDAHCYESGDANCFSTASIPYNGKTITLTIDLASRTIALTSISAQGYTMGDLMSTWGTPTGFSQFGRDIDVYWGTQSAHLTTCLFQSASQAELVTYYPRPAFASPWRGFVRVNSKDC